MYRSTLALLFLLCVNYGAVQAQTGSVSPYSRFGLGEIYDLQFAQNTGMGGATIALSDSFLVNVANPASYGQLARFNPVLDVGARGKLIRFFTATDSAKNYSISLSNIVLAIPLSKRAGMAFGIIPFSTSGYNIAYNVYDNTFGNLRYVYNGTGGINRVFLGAAYTPVRSTKQRLSIGINASYLFGEMQKTRKLYFLTSGSGLYHTKVVSSYFVHDMAFDAGLLYKNVINKQLTFRFGLTYALPLEVAASQTLLSHTFASVVTESIVDTVAYQDNVKGHFSLPAKWGYGISFDILGKRENNPGKLTVALQYVMQNWSTYEENFGTAVKYDFLRNSNNISAGLAYIPRTISASKSRIRTFALAHYRLGYYHKRTYLNLENTQIIDQGITFGVGIPLVYSYSYSMLNFGFELGTRGTTENGLIMERYFGMHFGYAFSPNRQSDRWFVKRRFD